MDHIDTQGAQIIKAMTLLLECAKATQIQIGEWAGIEGFGGFDQRNVYGRIAALDVAGRGGAAKAATDDDDSTCGRPGVGRNGQQDGTRSRGFADTTQPLPTRNID